MLKILRLNKKHLAAAAVLLAAVVAFSGCIVDTVRIVAVAASPKRDLPIYSVDRQDMYVSLSFDAACDEKNMDTKKSVFMVLFFACGQTCEAAL